MHSVQNNILYFVVLNIIVQAHGLVELTSVEENDIAITEAILRRTINTIFTSLKLRQVKHKTRLKEFSGIHNFFASITLQDHSNLMEIAKLTKVHIIDNSTQNFITLINEVLNEDDKKDDEAIDDVYVTTHIETFIKKLEYLKYKYGFDNHVGNYNINSEIIKHLNTDKLNDDHNVTQEIKKTNDSDENVLSDNEFWQPSGRRIFEGERVKIKRYPFMASVQFFKKFQCGGSIIKSDLVITAASCLQLAWNNRFFRENPAFLSVQVGCNFYEGGDENIPIQEVYFNPEYDPKSLKNNLAVMRLTRILKFGRKVKKVKKIDFDRNAWALPETIGRITVIGWGARSNANIIKDPWATRLGVSHLDFYPLKLCQDVYSKEYVTYKNFCAGFFSKGGGACNRDVGGPGVAHGILMGVISFGSPNCGAPDAPTVFTKLGYYSEWLEGIMEQDVPKKKVATTMRPIKFPKMFIDVHESHTTFKISPVTYDTGILQPIPIVDSLRTDETQLFKDFISTMFSSSEIQEYLNEAETVLSTDSDKSTETKSIAAAREITRKVKPIIKLSTTELPTTEHSFTVDRSSDDDDTVKMVTTIEKFAIFDSSQETAVTESNVLTKFTVIDDVPIDNRMERKIAQLIDNIDIKQLLESDPKEVAAKVAKETLGIEPSLEKYGNGSDDGTSETDSGDQLTIAVVADNQNDMVNYQNYRPIKANIVPNHLTNHNFIPDSPNHMPNYLSYVPNKQNYALNVQNNVPSIENHVPNNQNQMLNDHIEINYNQHKTGLLTKTKKQDPTIMIIKNKEPTGMVINDPKAVPLKQSFKDLTFRQNTTGFLSLFSQDELINLLTEAVAENPFANKIMPFYMYFVFLLFLN